MKKNLLEDGSMKLEEVTLIVGVETYECLGSKNYRAPDEDHRDSVLSHILDLIGDMSDPQITVLGFTYRPLSVTYKEKPKGE